MPYNARVLQILIASPGDVAVERKIIADVIYEWNYMNSRERSVVLLPLRWETHAFPEVGAAPQTAINEQVVAHSDIAVGVFWTRLGTPTETAASGTAEEISRVVDAGKPAMLYFSRGKVELQSTDLKEYERLDEFKEGLRPKALIADYQTHEEFRNLFQRHLHMQISEIIAKDATYEDHSSIDSEQMALTVMAGTPPRLLDEPNTLRLVKVVCKNSDEIPDYRGGADFTGGVVAGNYAISTGLNNSDYYRELVDYVREINLRRTLSLAISNSSDQSIRDIHLEVIAQSSSSSVTIAPNELPHPSTTSTALGPISTGFYSFPIVQFQQPAQPPKMEVEAAGVNEWRMETDIPAVQAKRTVSSLQFFTLAITESSSLTLDATVYSSDSRPFSLNSQISLIVETREMSYPEILRLVLPGYSEDPDKPDLINGSAQSDSSTTE
jgi:hypothetical protein